MSTERRENDAYYTPPWCVRELHAVWEPPVKPGLWVEPAVGAGHIVRAMNEVYPKATWLGYDLNPTGKVREIENLEVHEQDFLDLIGPNDSVTLAMSNFPFSSAQAFVEHTRLLYHNAYIMVLLRLGFLTSKERSTLWRVYGEPDLIALTNRPSFTDDGATDKYDYAWYGWPSTPRKVGSLIHLPSVSLEERQRGF